MSGIDCIHRDGRTCRIGEFGGSPTDIQCIRRCGRRVTSKPKEVAVPKPTWPGWGVSTPVPWYECVGITCEPKRRFCRDWMSEDLEDGRVAPSGAD